MNKDKLRIEYEKPERPPEGSSREAWLAYGRACIKAAPPEVRSEWSKHAQPYSAVSRTKNRRARDILREILAVPAKDVDLDMPIPGMENATIYDVILGVQAMKAAAGFDKSAEFVRDTVGDAPVAEAKIETSGFETPENNALLAKMAKRLGIEEEEE